MKIHISKFIFTLLLIVVCVASIGMGIYFLPTIINPDKRNEVSSATVESSEITVPLESETAIQENGTTTVLYANLRMPTWKAEKNIASSEMPANATIVDVEPNEQSNITSEDLKSLGIFKLTFYCSCSQCCGVGNGRVTATGQAPEEGRTISVDPAVIPLGSTVFIYGHPYVAEDVGSGVDGNTIDIFVDSHDKALARGIEYTEVFILK